MAQHNEEDKELGPPCLELRTSETPRTQVQFGEDLNTEQRWELTEMVRVFQDAFQETPGQAKGVEHEIRTPPGALIRERCRPIPQQLQEEVQQEIGKMQEQGIIYPS